MLNTVAEKIRGPGNPIGHSSDDANHGGWV